MSSPVAIAHARKAQSKHLLPVHAETCPHYLYLLSERLAATSITVTSTSTASASASEGVEDQHVNDDDMCEKHTHHEADDPWAGASHVCAPPLRHSDGDLQAVWDGVHNGTITVISSDHAPSRYKSALGKRKPVVEAQKAAAAAATASTSPLDTVAPSPNFAQIPNGLPGLETRLPLLFDAATRTPSAPHRSLSLPKFVELTSTNPARLYGLGGQKGSIAPGYDADVVIWYPPSHGEAATTIENRMLHHSIDYTAFEGVKVANWPRYVLLRGQVKWDRDVELREGFGRGLLGKPGDGNFLKRGKGEVLTGRVGQTPAGMKDGERSAWMH